MKRLLILRDKTGETKLINYLKKTLSPQAEVDQRNYPDLTFEIRQNKVKAKIANEEITNYDLVWLRTVGRRYIPLAQALASFLESKKIPYFDTVWGRGGRTNKLSDTVRLALAGLPVPDSLFYWRSRILENKQLIVKKLDLPLVAKNIWKNRGVGVFLLKNPNDFQKILEKVKPEDQFLFQRFHPNDGDYRVVVFGGKVWAWEKRSRIKDEFRNNAVLGGKEEFFPPAKIPSKMAEIAIEAAKVLHLQIAGVDILIDKNTSKMMILEVNRSPCFTTDFKISPEIPAVAAFLKSKIEKL